MISGAILFMVILLFLLAATPAKEAFLPVYSYLVGASNRLYKLLDAVKTTFEKHDIPYAITGNVLLSAVESQKLSRGQTQATVLVPQESVRKLLDASTDFLQLGLGMSDLRDGGFRLSSSVALPVLSDTSIMIFPVINTGDKWITVSKYSGYDEWYASNDLFPGKSYRLGNMEINGPSNALPYLHRNFWSLGLHSGNVRKKKWYQVGPRFYKPNRIPVFRRRPIITDVDVINGIDLDPRPLPGDNKAVILGNGRTAIVPNIQDRTFPRANLWRRYLWNG